ncbi:MAG: hypothetical protein JRE23_15880 [Deltaproteobacteria bacterium]|nr:hypothetical protein [Deltaproteobacteria bacterium]
MKRMKWLNCILIVLIAGMLTSAFAGTKHQFDKQGYDKIAKKTIGMIISGNIDADTMIADMEKLLEMGIAGCKEHMSEKETPPTEAKIMKITIDNAKKMTTLTLDEIESQWHEGGALKAKGIDISTLDHFAEVMCHYDAVVHPATAIICLNEYKKTQKEELLEQIEAELAEVREHLKHLE